MTTHITQSACSKSPETTPAERNILLVIGFLLSGPQPEIPPEFCRYRIGAFRCSKSLGPNRTVGPDLDICCISDDSGTIPLLHGPHAISGGTLIPHLGNHFVSFRRFRQHTGFINIMC